VKNKVNHEISRCGTKRSIFSTGICHIKRKEENDPDDNIMSNTPWYKNTMHQFAATL